jgi:hypothetical protein
MGRRFARHLDTDLIARIENGWKPKDRTEPMKRVRVPKAADEYRGARRNNLLRTKPRSTWRGIEPTGEKHHPPVRHNRSRKWDGVPLREDRR